MRGRLPLFCSVLLMGVSLVACDDPPASTAGVGERVQAPAPRPRAVEASLYDAEGIPQPSDQAVAGLQLPRGLTPIDNGDERLHLFASEVPVGPLLRYFGPRLTTVDVRRTSGRTVYSDAVPRDVRGGQVHLDVTIRESSAHAARVEVRERLPPPPEGVRIEAEEIQRHLTRQAENRE